MLDLKNKQVAFSTTPYKQIIGKFNVRKLEKIINWRHVLQPNIQRS